jgi:hypothetical protein
MVTVGMIRKLVKEEVDRFVRRSAGMFQTGMGMGRGIGANDLAPPGLGDEEEYEQQGEYEQKQDEREFSQLQQRAARRKTR